MPRTFSAQRKASSQRFAHDTEKWEEDGCLLCTLSLFREASFTVLVCKCSGSSVELLLPRQKSGIVGSSRQGVWLSLVECRTQQPVYSPVFPTRRRAKVPQQRTDALSRPFVLPRGRFNNARLHLKGRTHGPWGLQPTPASRSRSFPVVRARARRRS